MPNLNIEEYNKKSIKYWENREKKKLKSQVKDLDKLEKELYKEYTKSIKDINAKTSLLFSKYMEDNQLSYAEASKLLTSSEYKEWRMDLADYIKLIEETGDQQLLLELNTLAMKSRISRLEDLYYQIDKNINNLYGDFENKLSTVLGNSIQDNYYQSIYSIQKYMGKGTAFGFIDEDIIRDIMSYPWSGKNFSKTIWDNREKLKKNLKSELTQMIIQGKGNKEVAQSLANKMNVDFKHARTIINTEHSFIMSEASARGYKECDVEYYQFLATLDMKTSTICQKLDMKVFKMDDRKIGVNASPMHPNCRSTEIPYFEDEEDETRTARLEDGKTYEVPSDMTYDQWYEKHVKEKNENNLEIDYNNNKEHIIQKEDKTTKTKTTDKPKETKSKETAVKKKKTTYKQYKDDEFDNIENENDFLSKITEEEEDAILTYTEEDYEDINNLLRKKLDSVHEEVAKRQYSSTINEISKALKKGIAHDNIKVFRGSSASIFKNVLDKDTVRKIRACTMNGEDLDKMVKGMIIKDDGFISTSLSHKVPTEDFDSGMFLEIKIDKGARGGGYIAPISDMPNEYEWLLDKGSQLQIEKVTFVKSKNMYKVECKYIDPASLE